jgi:hypothetical protein
MTHFSIAHFKLVLSLKSLCRVANISKIDLSLSLFLTRLPKGDWFQIVRVESILVSGGGGFKKRGEGRPISILKFDWKREIFFFSSLQMGLAKVGRESPESVCGRQRHRAERLDTSAAF